MKVAYILLFSFGVANARPQNIISEFKSFFGIGDKPTSTSAKTLASAVSVSASSTNTNTNTRPLNPTIPSTASITPFPKSTRIDTTLSTITSISRSSRNSTESDSSTITSAPTTSTSSSILPPTPLPTTDPSSTQPNTSTPPSSISAGGIAVAVLMTIAILLAVAWLLFRYNPRIRAWYLAREVKKMQQRSYRQALDGPFSSRSAGGAGTSRKSMVASFFAPKTVKLGNGQEIRRKPVNWGSVAGPHDHGAQHGQNKSNRHPHPFAAELPGSVVMEKVALTEMAAPMARTGSQLSYLSNSGAGSNASSPALGKTLPAVPVSGSAGSLMPPLPPVPPIPPVPASKQGGGRGAGVHGILGRKSIYELA